MNILCLLYDFEEDYLNNRTTSGDYFFFFNNFSDSLEYIKRSGRIDLIISHLYYKEESTTDFLPYKIPVIYIHRKEEEAELLQLLSGGVVDSIYYEEGFLDKINYYIEKYKTFKKRFHVKNYNSIISHEMRTPLNSILGFASLLYEDENDPKKREKLAILKDSSKYLLNLINDILDLSRIQSGKIELENINFLLVNTLKHIYNLFKFQSQEKRINFSVVIRKNVPNIVLGDELRISQILINILSNSFKFTGENGNITLTASYKDKEVLFQIKDDGIGIPEDKVNTIFNPFEQADSSISRKYGGTGLGLSITENLIRIMGGRIIVKSKLNKGTTFNITIPIKTLKASDIMKGELLVQKWIVNLTKGNSDFEKLALLGISKLDEKLKMLDNLILLGNINELKSFVHQFKGFTGTYGISDIYNIVKRMDEELKKELPDLKIVGDFFKKIEKIVKIIPVNYFVYKNEDSKEKKKINKNCFVLFAEDNHENQKLLEAYCESLDINYKIVSNGVEAIMELHNNKYDILFLDSQMPKKDGMATLNEIRTDKDIKDIYIAILTAEDPSECEKRFRDAGADDVISKPIEIDILENKIISVMSNIL